MEEYVKKFKEFLESQGIVIGKGTIHDYMTFLKVAIRVMRYVNFKVMEAPEILLYEEEKLVTEAINQAMQAGIMEDIEKYFELGVLYIAEREFGIRLCHIKVDLEELRETKDKEELMEYDRSIITDCNNLKEVVLRFNELSPLGKISEKIQKQLIDMIDEITKNFLENWTSLVKEEVTTN